MQDLERRRGPITDAMLAEWFDRIFRSATAGEILDVRPGVQKERLFRQKREVWSKFGYTDLYLEGMKSQAFWDAEYAKIEQIDRDLALKRDLGA
jgi:hypothetical protein